MENNHGEPPAAALSPTELELNAWRELGEEMGRVISLMPAETFADWFPDWFGPRLFDLQVGAKASAALSPSEELTGDEVSSVVAHLGSGPFKNRVLAMLKAEPNIHGRLFTFRDLREHGQDWGGNPWPTS